MKTHFLNRNDLGNIGLKLGISLLLVAGPSMAQSARVDSASVEFTPDASKKELTVGFRLVDDVAVTSVSAAAEGRSEALPTTWEAWEGDKAPACAWMIVVDTSNPARAKTVATGVDFIRSFLTGLPKKDSVAIFSLARDLSEVVPFGKTPDERVAGLVDIKPSGDASLTTLIHANLRESLDRLEERKEPRKAILFLTDGKDETPGGPAAQEIEKNKLIEAATAVGVVIHTVGYAESADDQKYFAALKEISGKTDGLFEAASLAGKDLPSGFLPLLRGVMHGAGIVRIDLSKLAEPAALTVTVKTAAGKTAKLQVPEEKVVEALPPMEVEPTPATEEEKAAEEAKKAEEEAEKAEAAKKLAADEAEAAKKLAADKAAAEKKKRMWIYISISVLLTLILAAILMLRASRKRTEEEDRLAEEARVDQENQMAEEEKRAEKTRLATEQAKKAEDKPLAWLEMCDAQQTQHPVRIPSLKIGRGQHNDFVLRNDCVSGNHCVLNCNREGEWSVTDLNSGNGVVLNGERVQQAGLRHGDTIELGELKMRFLLRV
jgi:hypothetical protein